MLKIISEHYNKREPNKLIDFGGKIPYTKDYFYQFTRKRTNEKLDCFRIYSKEEEKLHFLSNSYFIGVDWIIEKEYAIYVEPKLNEEDNQTDYLSMLFSALKHPETLENSDDLFEIKWESEPIEINQKLDLLTPLLIVQYLKTVQRIVRKGLKKSYYKVEQNLYGKVKGKVLVSETIKKNHFKNKPLNTFCSFDEFGFNGVENRLLKKALNFSKRYLDSHSQLNSAPHLTQTFAYINPAFENVTNDVSLHEVKHNKTNIFYKEYEEGIRLAKLILKKFSYNIVNTETKQKIKTPPFWIDMSKLFELYVLGLLKEKFKTLIKYHPTYNSKELDFLLMSPPMVIDAKYKPRYLYTGILDDARQLSGYARMRKVYEELNHPKDKTIECLIIYPNQNCDNNDLLSFDSLINQPDSKINEYVGFFKIGIKLPLIKQ